MRDHVLGCTVATGDGRLVKAGGRVVKNVAGYDLTKLQVGGFGGFGIIAEAHLRLRALPRADVTLVARGTRDTLTSAARDVMAAELVPAALELLSPALAAEADWVLGRAVPRHRRRGAGRRAPDRADRGPRVAAAARRTGPRRSGAWWRAAARAGRSPSGSASWATAWTTRSISWRTTSTSICSRPAPGAGMIRWTGDAPVERLRAVRRAAAAREIPMTLERAPWPVRRALGHFGAYREGVGQLVGRLRETSIRGSACRWRWRAREELSCTAERRSHPERS